MSQDLQRDGALRFELLDHRCLGGFQCGGQLAGIFATRLRHVGTPSPATADHFCRGSDPLSGLEALFDQLVTQAAHEQNLVALDGPQENRRTAIRLLADLVDPTTHDVRIGTGNFGNNHQVVSDRFALPDQVVRRDLSSGGRLLELLDQGGPVGDERLDPREHVVLRDVQASRNLTHTGANFGVIAGRICGAVFRDRKRLGVFGRFAAGQFLFQLTDFGGELLDRTDRVRRVGL